MFRLGEMLGTLPLGMAELVVLAVVDVGCVVASVSLDCDARSSRGSGLPTREPACDALDEMSESRSESLAISGMWSSTRGVASASPLEAGSTVLEARVALAAAGGESCVSYKAARAVDVEVPPSGTPSSGTSSSSALSRCRASSAS